MVSRGDFIECFDKKKNKYLRGYIKEIGDSALAVKNPFAKKHIIPYKTIDGIRRVPKSRIYFIPILGVLVSGAGAVAYGTGLMDYRSSSGVAAVGVLIVSMNILAREIKNNPEKLRACCVNRSFELR